MRIARHLLVDKTSPFTVTGKDYDRKAPSEAAAIAVAMQCASRGPVGSVFEVRVEGETIGTATRFQGFTKWEGGGF